MTSNTADCRARLTLSGTGVLEARTGRLPRARRAGASTPSKVEDPSGGRCWSQTRGRAVLPTRQRPQPCAYAGSAWKQRHTRTVVDRRVAVDPCTRRALPVATRAQHDDADGMPLLPCQK